MRVLWWCLLGLARGSPPVTAAPKKTNWFSSKSVAVGNKKQGSAVAVGRVGNNKNNVGRVVHDNKLAVAAGVPRIVYVRVPKAGSTTLQLILRRVCTHEELVPRRLVREAAKNTTQEAAVGCSVEHVKFGPWFFERFPSLKAAVLIGIVRSPLARATSMFFEDNGFCRGSKSTSRADYFKRPGALTLEEAVLRFALDCKWQLLDGQYKYLKGNYQLESPLAVLKHYDAVVVSERLEESLVALLHYGSPKIPLEKLVTFGQSNHHTQHARVTDHTTQAMATFLSLNRFDVALHALAERHLDARKAKIGPAAFGEALETLKAYEKYAEDCLEEYTTGGGEMPPFYWPAQLEGCFSARLYR